MKYAPLLSFAVAPSTISFTNASTMPFVPARATCRSIGQIASRLTLGTLGLSILLLGACAIDAPRIERPAPTVETKVVLQEQPPSSADKLLQYMVQIRGLNSTDAQAERERVRTEYTADRSEYNRLKLAIALALPSLPTITIGANGNQLTSVPAPTSANDDAELIVLTEPIAAASLSANGFATEPEMRALAMLIQSLAQDRKRLRDQTQEIQTKAQAKTREDVAAVKEEARNLRLKVEELEKQLTELKSIERSVNSRNTDRSNGAPK